MKKGKQIQRNMQLLCNKYATCKTVINWNQQSWGFNMSLQKLKKLNTHPYLRKGKYIIYYITNKKVIFIIQLDNSRKKT